MKYGVVVLPAQRWPDALRTWRELDEVGFDSAWTYDHVEWRPMPGAPWYAAYALLAAVAASTSRIRIGTLVTSINLREPVMLAQDIATIDEVSGGRFELGIGAGSRGFDSMVFGQEPWTPGERVERLAEYVELLDQLLTNDRTTFHGTYYDAVDAPISGGRVPFTIAADGPRSMRVAARFGQRWVANTIYGDVAEKCHRLDDVCVAIGRDPTTLGRVLLIDHSTAELSVAQIDEQVGDAVALGFEEVVVRHPLDGDRAVFDAIIEGLPGRS